MPEAGRPPKNRRGYVYVNVTDEERKQPEPLPAKRRRQSTNFFITEPSPKKQRGKKKKKKTKKTKKTKKKKQKPAKGGAEQQANQRKKRKRPTSSSSRPSPAKKRTAVADVSSETDPVTIAVMKDAAETVDHNGLALRTSKNLAEFMYRVLVFHDRGRRHVRSLV
jgi:hypothetical protein